LLAFDLASGTLQHRFDAPPIEGGRALNDVSLGPDGSVYTSDANDGSIFQVAPRAVALRPVCALGILKSPQGMVVSRDGRTLLVADYEMGLVALDVTRCEVRQLRVARGVTTLTMDGLLQLPDGSFLATQNGVRPARLVRFRLSPDWSRVTLFKVVAQGPQFVDPTLLAKRGAEVLAITNSQWSAFGDSSVPARPLMAWRLVSVRQSAIEEGGTLAQAARRASWRHVARQ
jgi:sugar lactone lactonase YvrE